MTVLRLLPLAACGSSDSGANFDGTAKDLALSEADASYEQTTDSIPVDEPDTEELRDGFGEGTSGAVRISGLTGEPA